MSDPRTVRVLSFDGGGMRGYFSALWFKRFVNYWGINPTEVWKYFDIFSGTSIGGIISLSLAYGLTPDELLPFFTVDGPWIFTIRSAIDVGAGSINASFPSNRPYTSQKIIILGQNDQFYRSVDPASNYGSARLKTRLIETFGDATLQDLKVPVIIPSYKANTDTFVLFSNLNYGEFVGQNESIVNVALATSAAPLYLPPHSFGGGVYFDGGIYQNNPAQIALNTAKSLNLLQKRSCVLSVGTGLGTVGFHEEENPNEPPPPTFPFEQTIKDLDKIIDAAMKGSQESVAFGLTIEGKYTPSNSFRYRVQTIFDPSINTDLDNSDADFLTYMENKESQVFYDDIDNISIFLGHLTA